MRFESKPMHRAAWLGFMLVLMLIMMEGLSAQFQTPGGIRPIALPAFVITTLGCVGVTGYALDRRIGSLLLWQVVFFMTVFGIAAPALSLVLHFKIETLGQLVLGAAFSGPIAYALFKYAYRTPHLWPMQPIPEKLALIEDALPAGAHFEATKPDPKTSEYPTVHVNLYRDSDSFVVRIRRCNASGEKAYLNRFDSMTMAMAFITANTPVTEADLARVA